MASNRIASSHELQAASSGPRALDSCGHRSIGLTRRLFRYNQLMQHAALHPALGTARAAAAAAAAAPAA